MRPPHLLKGEAREETQSQRESFFRREVISPVRPSAAERQLASAAALKVSVFALTDSAMPLLRLVRDRTKRDGMPSTSFRLRASS